MGVVNTNAASQLYNEQWFHNDIHILIPIYLNKGVLLWNVLNICHILLLVNWHNVLLWQHSGSKSKWSYTIRQIPFDYTWQISKKNSSNFFSFSKSSKSSLWGIRVNDTIQYHIHLWVILIGSTHSYFSTSKIPTKFIIIGSNSTKKGRGYQILILRYIYYDLFIFSYTCVKML